MLLLLFYLIFFEQELGYHQYHYLFHLGSFFSSFYVQIVFFEWGLIGSLIDFTLWVHYWILTLAFRELVKFSFHQFQLAFQFVFSYKMFLLLYLTNEELLIQLDYLSKLTIFSENKFLFYSFSDCNVQCLIYKVQKV